MVTVVVVAVAVVVLLLERARASRRRLAKVKGITKLRLVRKQVEIQNKQQINAPGLVLANIVQLRYHKLSSPS